MKARYSEPQTEKKAPFHPQGGGIRVTPTGIKGENGKSGGQKLIVRGTEAKGAMRSIPGIQPGAKLLVEMYEIEESHQS